MSLKVAGCGINTRSYVVLHWPPRAAGEGCAIVGIRANNEGIFKGTVKVLSFGPGPALALGGVGGSLSAGLLPT